MGTMMMTTVPTSGGWDGEPANACDYLHVSARAMSWLLPTSQSSSCAAIFLLVGVTCFSRVSHVLLTSKRPHPCSRLCGVCRQLNPGSHPGRTTLQTTRQRCKVCPYHSICLFPLPHALKGAMSIHDCATEHHACIHTHTHSHMVLVAYGSPDVFTHLHVLVVAIPTTRTRHPFHSAVTLATGEKLTLEEEAALASKGAAAITAKGGLVQGTKAVSKDRDRDRTGEEASVVKGLSSAFTTTQDVDFQDAEMQRYVEEQMMLRSGQPEEPVDTRTDYEKRRQELFEVPAEFRVRKNAPASSSSLYENASTFTFCWLG